MTLFQRSDYLLLFVLVLLLVACSSTAGAQTGAETMNNDQAMVITDFPTATIELPTATPLPPTETASPTPLPAMWIADYVPAAVVTGVTNELGDQVQITENRAAATMQLDVASETAVAEWVYALVAPFPMIYDGLAFADLQSAWSGDLATEPFTNFDLMMDDQTYEVFTQLWGEASAGAVQIVPTDELLQTTWENQPSWAIVPFENLDPQWKVLQIDGLSPVQKDFNPEAYPLTINFGLNADLGIPISPLTNRDPNKMTDIMLTGVTAMVRGTALTMERLGITYPGEDIAPLTRAVDFMHVNNEIPFTPDCPYPDLYPKLLVFCSDVDYLELLQSIGTDFVEVSGDHFGDHGPEGTLFTLDLYDEVGLPYYGGGRNLEDGRKPYLIEHNGNNIAILGCNAITMPQLMKSPLEQCPAISSGSKAKLPV